MWCANCSLRSLSDWDLFDSLVASGSVRRVQCKTKQNAKAMDIYNTVWLSDYDSCKSGMSSIIHSQSSLGHSSFTDSLTHPHRHHETQLSILDDSQFTSMRKSDLLPSRRVYKTLSLPDTEFLFVRGEDLQERFNQLQLEQENKQLLKLTTQLQEALAKLEKQFADHVERPESEQAYLSNIFSVKQCSMAALPLAFTPSSQSSNCESHRCFESRLTKYSRKASSGNGCCSTQ